MLLYGLIEKKQENNFNKIGSNQLDKVITFFVLNMAYSWDNRVDFVVRYMYGKFIKSMEFLFSSVFCFK